MAAPDGSSSATLVTIHIFVPGFRNFMKQVRFFGGLGPKFVGDNMDFNTYHCNLIWLESRRHSCCCLSQDLAHDFYTFDEQPEQGWGLESGTYNFENCVLYFSY